jgi:hypothetical protein
MVEISDQFSVYSFYFGHSTPDASPVKVRFLNLGSPWFPKVSDQVIVGCAVMGYG